MPIVTELFVIFCLVLANGLFAGAEIAILSVRKTRLGELADEGNRSAQALVKMRTHPENFLATVQIGITVVGATAGAFGGATLARALSELFSEAGVGKYSSDLALAAVVGLISYLSLVIGELVPKSLALRSAERYALFVARPLRALGTLARPVVWFLTASSNLVLRLFGDRTTFAETHLSREELQQLVDEAANVGELDPEVGEIARRALDFEDVRIGAIMVPRQFVVALNRDATRDEIRELLVSRAHSRIPIYATSIDDIVGYVTARDLFALLSSNDERSIETILRAPRFVLETRRAVDVLRDLQSTREQLVFVIDEQGTIAGIATTEDLVEELVGEIFAEHDAPNVRIRKEDDGSIVVRGHVPVHELNRDFDLDLPERPEVFTIGGLAAALVGHVPKAGTRVITGKTTLEILDATDRRVVGVRLRTTDSSSTDS